MKPLALTEDQVLWFRARRLHLAPPGAPDAVAAARANLGAQSQQLGPSLLGLSLRTKGRPTAAALTARLFEAPRSLVRTWGNRGTLHVYDPAHDWPHVIAALKHWANMDRSGAMPTESAVEKARKRMLAADAPIVRKDLHDLVSPRMLREMEERVGKVPAAMGYAASRLVWRLAQQGDACMAGKVGSQQAYAARAHWFPELEWPNGLDTQAAAIEMARRYLSGYGPATSADVAHFFGARVSMAQSWVEALQSAGDLIPVQCGDRPKLVALATDKRTLQAAAPTTAMDWPLRLLPMWDGHLMGHADKTWTVPDAADRKRVWRKSAMVAATALHRGRVVANWTHKVARKRLHVQVEPLSAWRTSKHAAALRREAAAVAAHLELDGAEVAIEN